MDPKPKPTHYKVVSISMYVGDIIQLKAKVQILKSRGYTTMSKSKLIRLALDQIDATTLEIPRQ